MIKNRRLPARQPIDVGRIQLHNVLHHAGLPAQRRHLRQHRAGELELVVACSNLLSAHQVASSRAPNRRNGAVTEHDVLGMLGNRKFHLPLLELTAKILEH